MSLHRNNAAEWVMWYCVVPFAWMYRGYQCLRVWVGLTERGQYGSVQEQGRAAH